ncbi:MAG: alpha-ketoacid dehydrogenase subunit beta [Limnohabitans sp.]
MNSAITYAQASLESLSYSMTHDASIVAMGEDLGRGGVFGQYTGLREKFGSERVIDTPISEAGIAGAAVGMALAGLRPVVEMRVIDFALCAMDEMVNQAAKNRYMFGGQGRVPVVFRMPIGLWSGSAAQHSQSLESWFTHIPGLTVVAPATAQDNYALFKSALKLQDPVLYLEHKELWSIQSQVDTQKTVEIGIANCLRPGKHLTLVTWSSAVHRCLSACQNVASLGLEVELIDLRSLWPWDKALVYASSARTGKLLVVHDAVQVSGFGAEIAASTAQATGCLIHRLGAPRIPVGYSPILEDQTRISVNNIERTIMQFAGKKRES